MNDHMNNELGWMLDDVLQDAGGAARDPAVRRRACCGRTPRASTGTRPNGTPPRCPGCSRSAAATAEFCGQTARDALAADAESSSSAATSSWSPPAPGAYLAVSATERRGHGGGHLPDAEARRPAGQGADQPAAAGRGQPGHGSPREPSGTRGLVRPYVVTGGRAHAEPQHLRPGHARDRHPRAASPGCRPEKRRLMELCRGGALSVAEIAAHLCAAGQRDQGAAVRPGRQRPHRHPRPASRTADRPTTQLLQEVLDGLRARL